jgi:hypothetical protein
MMGLVMGVEKEGCSRSVHREFDKPKCGKGVEGAGGQK